MVSYAVTPLGSPGPRLPPEARSPAPRRVTWRGGSGPASAAPVPVTPAKPAAARSPAPRRASWRGLASQAVTPLGNPGPPKPFIFRSPAPRRSLAGNNLQCGDGIASRTVTPLGSPSFPPSRPVIQHLPARRAVTGFLGRNAGGYPGHNACPAFPLAGPYVYQSMLVPAYSYPNPPTFWNLLLDYVPPERRPAGARPRTTQPSSTRPSPRGSPSSATSTPTTPRSPGPPPTRTPPCGSPCTASRRSSSTAPARSPVTSRTTPPGPAPSTPPPAP